MTLEELLHAPLFDQLGPHIRLELYGRDGGPRKVRRRIELRTGPLDAATLQQALTVECECVHCGAPIHPFRTRAKLGDRVEDRQRHVYMAVACPLNVSVGCSRGAASRNAYLAIRQRVELLQSQPQQPLPQGWGWELRHSGWVATDGMLCVSSRGDHVYITALGDYTEPAPWGRGVETRLGAPWSVVTAVLTWESRQRRPLVES